jgi:hypothetical protein
MKDRPGAARLVSQIMVQLRSYELMTLNTERARNKVAVQAAHSKIVNNINQLLYQT